MPPPVSEQLMSPVGQPVCSLTKGAESYTGAEIAASLDCWRNAWAVASGKHQALAKAVRLREVRVAEAVKASVR